MLIWFDFLDLFFNLTYKGVDLYARLHTVPTFRKIFEHQYVCKWYFFKPIRSKKNLAKCPQMLFESRYLVFTFCNKSNLIIVKENPPDIYICSYILRSNWAFFSKKQITSTPQFCFKCNFNIIFKNDFILSFSLFSLYLTVFLSLFILYILSPSLIHTSSRKLQVNCSFFKSNTLRVCC